jgi:spore coat polysaccharide biosynthesis predicted glycosyltransferase SpsG
MVIDDLDREWESPDFVLDSALDAEDRYLDRSRNWRGLFGPAYVPMHPTYKSVNTRHEIRRKIKNVVLFFGGVDAPNTSSKVLELLLESGGLDYEVCVIVGSQNIHREGLIADFSVPGIRFVDPADCMYEHLRHADIAIGAGGTTTWERLCAGVPSVVVAIAENQMAMVESLGASGHLAYLRLDEIGNSSRHDELEWSSVG